MIRLLCSGSSGRRCASGRRVVSRRLRCEPLEARRLLAVDFWPMTAEGAPDPPVVTLVDESQTLNEGGTLTSSGSFTDVTGSSWTATVDYGEGDGPVPLTLNPGNTFDLSHAYAGDGVFTVTVSVRSNLDEQGIDSLLAIVNNVAPTIGVANQSISEGDAIDLSGFVTAADVGAGDTLTYQVDWGDGSTIATGFVNRATNTIDATHHYADDGTYNASVTVSDNADSASAPFDVTVSNVAPTVTAHADHTIGEDQTFTLVDLASISDPGFANPANPLHTPTGSAETFTYTINWGDGTAIDSGTATIDTVGSGGTPTAASLNGTHAYDSPGTYTVTVSVEDDDGGGPSTDTLLITVEPNPPVVAAGADRSINEGDAVTVAASFTDAGDIGLHSATIDWGDGSPVVSGMVDQTAHTVAGSHHYADNGDFTVTVMVRDQDAAVGSDTFTVTVRNVAPTLTVGADQEVDEGAPLTLAGVATFTDPGFDHPPGGTSETFTYSIDWGDGTTDTGVPAIDTPGAPTVPTEGSVDAVHVYGDDGVFTASVTVEDDDGDRQTRTFRVTVHNVAPTLDPVVDQVVQEGSLLNLPGIVQFTDPGFDTATAQETFTYVVDWGDGSPTDTGSARVDTVGSEGTATAGSIDADHTYADDGDYTVQITVTDDDGGASETSLQVEVTGAPPTVAAGDDLTADEGQTVSLTQVTFNDPGTLDTHTAEISWGDGTPPETVPVTEAPFGPPGDPAGVDGVLSASHVYAEDGAYTVVITVTDDNGLAGSDSLVVTVDNVDPTLGDPPDLTVAEGSEFTLGPILFTDPGTLDTHTATVDWGDGSAIEPATVDETPFGPPGDPAGMSGTVTATHRFGDSDTFDVVVTLVDNDGGTHERTFAVTVDNGPPVVAAAANTAGVEGTPLSITDVGSFEDPGWLDTHTVTIDWGDGTPADTPAIDVDDPGDPGPLQGSFDGTHTFGDAGTFTVTVTVTDDDGAVGSDTLSIEIENVPPALAVIVDQTIDEGTPLDLTAITSFVDPGLADQHTATIDWGDGSDPQSVNIAIGDRVIPAEHAFPDDGSYEVSVTVADDNGGEDTRTFEVTVDNVAPTLDDPGDQTVEQLTELCIDLHLTDPGRDNPLADPATVESFTYSINWGDGVVENDIDALPVDVDLTGSEVTLPLCHTYVDEGTYPVVLRVEDDDGDSATHTFDVVVLRAPPTIDSIDPPTADEGQAVTIDGSFRDGTLHTHDVSIDWGDGTVDTLPAGDVDQDAHTFTAEHTYGDSGPQAATITVTASDGETGTLPLTIEVANVAPVLSVVADQSVREGEELSLTDLGTLTDVGWLDTHSVTINWGDGTAVDSPTVDVDDPGGPGSPFGASFDGSHTYGDNGTFTVTVTATDDDGGAANATFAVNVDNVAPELIGLAVDQTVAEGVELTLTDMAEFMDPGWLDTFTYEIDWGDGTPVENGVPTTDVAGGPGAVLSGTFDGSHTYGDNGTYTVSVTIADDDGDSDTASFEVDVTNAPPVLEPIADQTLPEGTLLRFGTTDPGCGDGAAPRDAGDVTFSDAGWLDTHTFTIDWGDGSTPTTGTANVVDAGGPGQPLVGELPASHAFADNGVYLVTVTVEDDDGATDTTTLSVAVTNVAPIIEPIDLPPEVDIDVEFRPAFFFRDAGFDNPDDAPPTQESFTYVVDWGDGTTDTGAVTGVTTGSACNDTTGQPDVMHVYTVREDLEITVTITDDDGGTTTETYPLHVGFDAVLAGQVYVDLDHDNTHDPIEDPLPGIHMVLDGVSFQNIAYHRVVCTDADGRYRFEFLPSGDYTIMQVQPAAFADADGNETEPIALTPGEQQTDHDFRELAIRPQYLSTWFHTASRLPAGSPAWQAALQRIIEYADEVEGTELPACGTATTEPLGETDPPESSPAAEAAPTPSRIYGPQLPTARTSNLQQPMSLADYLHQRQPVVYGPMLPADWSTTASSTDTLIAEGAPETPPISPASLLPSAVDSLLSRTLYH